MKIKLTSTEQIKKDTGLCIVPGCPKEHGKGMNICYSHKEQRQRNKQNGDDPMHLAYDGYCKTQLKHELAVITFDEFKKRHIELTSITPTKN